MPTSDRVRPAPYIAGLAGASAVALAGVWLVIAPFASGYQPDGADWVDATLVGVASGAALILLGLVTMIVLVRALRAEARRRGITPRTVEQTATGDEPPSDDEAPDDLADEPADLEAVLAPLAAALLEDLRNGHEHRQLEHLVDHPPRTSADHPPA